jgi:two-component system sensor histidine kinase UhpB
MPSRGSFYDVFTGGSDKRRGTMARWWGRMQSITAKGISASIVRDLTRGLGLCAGGLGGQLLSAALWNSQSDAPMVWFTGAVLLAALLCLEVRDWAASSIGWGAGVLASAAVFPLRIVELAVLTPALMALIVAVAWMLKSYRRERRFADFGGLAVFFAIGVVVLPVCSSLAVMTTAWHFAATSQHPLESWLQLTLSWALGYTLLVPALVCIADAESVALHDWIPDWRTMVVTVGALALLWLMWRSFGHAPLVRPVLLLLPLPLVIFMTLRARIPGASVAILLFGVIAMQISLEGRGPFLTADMTMTALSVQLWTLGMSLAALFLAALIEQRRMTQRALVDSSGQLRELAGRLIVAQEQERARIARELHDDINQRLALASIQLSAIRRKVDEKTGEDIGELQHQLISLSDDVRHLSHDLHPSMLSHTGLTAALAGLCQAQRQRGGPTIDLRVSPHTEHLSQDVALCLYRVTQEALSNAVRHASAHRVTVVLDVDAAHAALVVTDDGVGFTLSAQDGAETTRGLGLLSMDERVRSLDGELHFASSLGKGTQLCIRIPLRHPEQSGPV